ncbi:UNVERIFIED_CONTAM: hypothetical protein FKN15_033868 [Acipenser sinensis]
MLTHIFNLKQELRTFLADKKPKLAEVLKDDVWLAKLGYLADIFSEMKLCKMGALILLSSMKELTHSKGNYNSGKFVSVGGTADMFELLHSFIQDFDIIKLQLAEHLSGLLNKYNTYFPELMTEQAATHQWATNPISENIEAKLPPSFPSTLFEELPQNQVQ